MKLFNGGNVTTGIAVGIGFMVLAPLAARMLSGAGKPLIKESVKGGLFLYDRGRTIWAEARETLEDVTAEAQSELSQSKELPAAAKK